jgi:twitching motility protein PilT
MRFVDLPDDLERVAEELNTLVRPQSPRAAAQDSDRLLAWLAQLVDRRGSELVLVAGAPPSGRFDGRVESLGEGPLDGPEIEDAVLPALRPDQQRRYRDGGIVDGSIRVAPHRRFRINLHRERGRAAACIRALPAVVPRLADLRFPLPIDVLAAMPRGLVLVCGPTGSGKSTTVAAIVNEISRRERHHVITIEDPIEYEHPHQASLVEQVEIGLDAPDFPTALRAAMRQAPDVLVVGEMRDPETMRMGLVAAETGHLVISTLHATDAASAIARIIDSFPAERQATVRQELAMSLSAVLTQSLMRRADGQGRVPAAELLVLGYGARQHVRKSAYQHLHQEITITRKLGSFTLEEALARLVQSGAVDRADALTKTVHAEELEQLLG